MADVAADVDAEVSADGAGEGVSWVGGTEHDTAGLDGILAFPHLKRRKSFRELQSFIHTRQGNIRLIQQRTIEQTGPMLMYSMRDGKNFLPARSL